MSLFIKVYNSYKNFKAFLNSCLRKDILCLSYGGECYINFDEKRKFKLIVFNYGSQNKQFPHDCDLEIFTQTECKGDLMLQMLEFVFAKYFNFNKVCTFDDDIQIKVSELNRLFYIANKHSLDNFAPSLDGRSHHSHIHTLNISNIRNYAKGGQGIRRKEQDDAKKALSTQCKFNEGLRKCDWVEVMMPGFSRKFVKALLPIYKDLYKKYNFKSSWGVDKILFKYINLKIDGKCAIVDDISALHIRPITSSARVFSNRLTAKEEYALMLEHFRTQYQDAKF